MKKKKNEKKWGGGGDNPFLVLTIISYNTFNFQNMGAKIRYLNMYFGPWQNIFGQQKL